MKKNYTLSEYCIRFEVDFPTRKKMNKLSLLQSRISGGNDMHPHAKEAAEAECDRLNAEHRKEQK